MRHEPFDRAAMLTLLGRDVANFSPGLPQTRARVAALARDMGAHHVTSMQVGFRSEICEAHTAPEHVAGIAWSRAAQTADGVLVSRPRHAVFFANADCPVGLMYHADSGRMCVLHLGFGCLWAPKSQGSMLIERAFEALGPGHIQMFVAGGIGPCCYGVRTKTPEEVWRDAYLASLSCQAWGVASRGPRQGQRSLDLYAIIAEQARRADVTWDATCTSCHGAPSGASMGTYWSNVRDLERQRGRNMVLAMLM